MDIVLIFECVQISAKSRVGDFDLLVAELQIPTETFVPGDFSHSFSYIEPIKCCSGQNRLYG
ncbi:MAG: hypothetical protein C0469_02075 [Cyanobacteria bacterium DS2.3.42]|nr:hypothetical protein [Cyanobacteria bacterium DS2.3.42]